MADLLMGSPFAAANASPENVIDTLFCSIDCMKNPVKYVEYTKAEYTHYPFNKDFNKAIDYSTEKIVTKVVEYYSKESNDVALIIDFITKINKECDESFNLTMDNIKILLENSGNFFLFIKKETPVGLVKSKIRLRPIELKSV